MGDDFYRHLLMTAATVPQGSGGPCETGIQYLNPDSTAIN